LCRSALPSVFLSWSPRTRPPPTFSVHVEFHVLTCAYTDPQLCHPLPATAVHICPPLSAGNAPSTEHAEGVKDFLKPLFVLKQLFAFSLSGNFPSMNCLDLVQCVSSPLANICGIKYTCSRCHRVVDEACMQHVESTIPCVCSGGARRAVRIHTWELHAFRARNFQLQIVHYQVTVSVC
jgi:hypothetical protein